MSTRGSFSRSVARAAASGGGRAYRARRPGGWYLIMTAIVVAGLVLVVYSRNERLHPAAAANAGPGKTDNWHVALGFDICGTIQANLAANTNLATAGIRTFGDGLLDIDPGAVTTPANYEGTKATLQRFINDYAGIDISPTILRLPGKNQKTYTNGTSCTGPLHGAGSVKIKLWSSPTATGKVISTDPANLHLRNGQMITVAFVPKGASIPEPASKGALLAALGSSSATTTTIATVSGSTGAASTTTTVATPSGLTGAATSTTVGPTTTSAPHASGASASSSVGSVGAATTTTKAK